MAEEKALRIAPFALAFLTAVLLVFVLAPGANEDVLTGLYFLKVETGNLTLPSRLSQSDFLRDMSKVSGQDYIGPDVTPATLGISTTYTVHLFTCCGHGRGSSNDESESDDSSTSSCTTPLLGSSFDPFRNLRLDTTVLEGTYSDRMRSALRAHSHASPFIGAAFIVAFVAGLAAPTVLLLFAGRMPGRAAAWAAVGLGAVATALLLAAAAAATAVMGELARAMQAEFGPVGIRTSRGRLVAPAWAAVAVSVLATLSLFLAARKVPRKESADAGRSLKGKAPFREPFPSKSSTMTTTGTSTMTTRHSGILGPTHHQHHQQDPLRVSDLPPRLPMVGKGSMGGNMSGGVGAGFGMMAQGTESQSSRHDSELSVVDISNNSNSSRFSGGDKIIAEGDLNNTTRKEVPQEQLHARYAPYRPLEGNSLVYHAK